MSYHGPDAVNTTGHDEPTVYACSCGLTLEFDPGEPWSDRVRAVREHRVEKHDGNRALPVDMNGARWHFAEDYPR